MTATPIPRTLALAWYGDLDTSILRHPPAQRGVTQTHLRPSAALPRVWEFLKAELAAGRQAYVVLPRIDSEEPGVKVIEKEFAAIQEALRPHRCAVVHGRLSSNQRADTMEAFRANAVAVLIATSIIEVGVDVPNATVIVILSAELFGLAQLHQLRGRIGRGTHASHCILVSDAAEPLARERLGILERTADGFELAEADLRLRGTGELLGSAQSGAPRFVFADLARDHDLMLQARELTRAALPSRRT